MLINKLSLGFALLVVVGRTLSAADASAAASSAVRPETVGLSSARLERLAHAIQQDIDHGRMPGAVIAIARKGGC